MKPKNLISVYQGAAALDSIELPVDQKFKALKKHEIRNLNSFCDIMQGLGCTFCDFDGYYVGYSIGQIGKEFDLLRFGDELVINIELKSELKVANKEEKILKQMRINHYYLKFLSRKIKIITYVENDGFYEYEEESDFLSKVDGRVVATYVKRHIVNQNIDPDKEFVPSNYLISPFNSTGKFLRGEYFLTTAQQRIKDEIYTELADTPFMYFSISANAGTGKTLLMYDIAKDMIQADKKISIIHCGILNEGHIELRDTYMWNIRAVRDINQILIDRIFDGCSVVFIDEAQRIRGNQLSLVIEKSIAGKLPIIFSYDTKQFLRRNEGRTLLTFTTSSYDPDPYNLVASMGGKNAHNVIGQEFSKVALIMDRNFKYTDSGKLAAKTAYYSAQGMLYQIVTRVIDELKIVVLDNPELYLKLLEIKAMGK